MQSAWKLAILVHALSMPAGLMHTADVQESGHRWVPCRAPCRSEAWA